MYKSKLQELCQQRKWRLPEYNATKLGLDHNPRFSASITINGVAFDTVQLFRSSKEAQNDAARLAFAHFSDPQPRHTNRSPSPSSFPQPSPPASSALPSTAGTNLTDTHDTKQTLQPEIQETHETSYVPVQFSGIASGGNSQANGSTLGIEYGNRLRALPSTVDTNLTGTHDTEQTLQPKIQETHETSYVPVQFSGIASGGNSQVNGSTLSIEDVNRLRALPSTVDTNLTGTHDTEQTLQPKIQETHETSYMPVQFSGIASGGNSQANGSTLGIEDVNRLRALPSTTGTNLPDTHDTKQTLQPEIQETHETSYVPVQYSGIASSGNSQANGSTLGIEDGNRLRGLPSTVGTNLTGTHDTKQTLQPKIQETHETSYVPVQFSGIASCGNSQANGSTLGIEDGNRLRALPSTTGANLPDTHDTKQTLQPKIQETHETSYVPVQFNGIASGGNSQANGSTLGIEDGNRLRAFPSTAGTNLTGTHDTKQTLQPKIQETNESSYLPVHFSGIASCGNSQANGSTLGIEDVNQLREQTLQPKNQETHETSYVPVQFSGIASGGNSQANGSTLSIEDGNRLRDIQHLYKNQLQTYAQKRNLLLPVYSCEREGPPHASRFKCRVTVDEHTYEGQEFLPTMKEAEHAVAKVALMSLLPNGIQEDYIGLYKNVLQELIQKEGFSMPVYRTKNSGKVHVPIFVSTVEIEGETFTGSEARSKKQAEMSAAKVAYHTLRERKSSKIPLVRPPAQKGLETPEILSSSFQSDLATDLQQGRPNATMIVSPSAITGEQKMQNSVTAEGNSHHPDGLTTSSGFSSSDILYGRVQESYSSSLCVSRNGSSSTLPSDASLT
ncbi:double-stranded RNA-binding protein 1 isoform X2 [Prunus yedoensis var. nudiflora]|uniref:Double-stranded RNA-binding protein 1 isoform X2 n=1 Tax=Prunus yedoensis var. nudiflora TaxID=2094558 RepID=A0A314Z919_PRUYE|nr:double-stranded RNA-binding protein 1 isoform X2 [Prunus yedoensis var. nudiflora]